MAANKKISETQVEYQITIPTQADVLAKPFLKWAGGKNQLIPILKESLPIEFSQKKIKKYIEPFIGGGAFFFFIAQNYPEIESFFISDINQELILTYQTIKLSVESLIATLDTLEKKHHTLNKEEQKEHFYEIRSDFNKKLNFINFHTFESSWIERASQIIFLNKTCFNGLFRVNSKGEFNVPFGDYKNPKICDRENLLAVHKVLQKTEISFGDFTMHSKFIDKKTFIYFDPPYRPISDSAHFTSYSKFEFGDKDQEKLAEYFCAMSLKEAKLMLSNSDPKNKNQTDNFFDELYKDFSIQRVEASRMINSNGAKRGKIKELIITNY